MFLKNKWRNLSIKKKIFIWSTLILLISFSLLYIFMYLFMPKVYEAYKIGKIKGGIEAVKITFNNNENAEINDVLDDFSYKNNVDVVLVKRSEYNYINKIIYSSFKDGINNPKKIPFLEDFTGVIPQIGFNNYREQLYKQQKGQQTDELYKLRNKKDALTLDEEIYVKSMKDVYNLIVHVSEDPISEATKSMQLFFPFAVIGIVIIAFAVSTFYALLISKPLIKINTVAKKMANLDFDNVIEIEGKDEIGQLSSSLNLMNTNLKESFEELEKINSKLTEEIEVERKLEKERREFIATISHELKSPITIVSGQLEGMMYNIGKYKDRDKYLQESYDVIQKMRELVQEILQLSERENVNFKYKFTKVNISNLIKNTVNELQFFIKEKDLRVEEDIKEDIFIIADEKLIKKVITNIIKNAINYSPSREMLIIRLEEHKLLVENTGVTIPKDELSEIFNAFYRVDKSRNRKTGGTGLGLYIVKTILDKHENINYSIESKENSVIFKMKF